MRRVRDPLGGRSVDTIAGERGLFVRRSKVAMARYLAKKGTAEHTALRHRLRREAAAPRNGDVASAAWARAVEAVQKVAGRPVTGELDGELVQLLLPVLAARRRAQADGPQHAGVAGDPRPDLAELQPQGARLLRPRAHALHHRADARAGPHQAGGAPAREGAGAPARAAAPARRRPAAPDHLRLPDQGLQRHAHGGRDELRPHARLRGRHPAAARRLARPAPRARARRVRVRRGLLPARPRHFIHGDFDHTLGGRRTW